MNESVKQESFFGRYYILFIVAAYIFSVAMRYIWVDWASAFPQFFWNSQLMINTNDGYFWAEGARDILAGFHQKGDLSPVSEPASILSAWLARILPVSFETLILWMPAFIGSLLVLPVMLIARTLGLHRVGIVAGFITGIVWSYYNRTMVGYYDTDMLTIVLPTFSLWLLILSVREEKNRYLFLMALSMLLYEWWYPSAKALEMAFGATVLIYTLLFERRKLFNYKLLIFIVIAAAPISIAIKSLASLLIFLYFHFYGEKSERYILYILAAVVSIFILLGGLGPIWQQIKGYILREAVDSASAADMVKLHYYAVSRTVREAGAIPFEIFANRISGSPYLLILSVAGYILMAVRYRIMLLALPMLGLGFIAMKGGLRFTVYAVAIAALGYGYLSVWLAEKLEAYMKDSSRAKKLSSLFILLMLGLSLYPNIVHIYNYKVPTVFKKSEVEVLDKLGKIADREDYVLSWWDYGYPIRYYSDVKTLIDGGKHTGRVNFPVSFALCSSQTASANMARLDVEYTERELKKESGKRSDDYMALMMKDYGFEEPSLFLESLEDSDLKLPAKSREIYYYLPYRMLPIFPTVKLFSNLDLETGKSRKSPFFYKVPFVMRGGKIMLDNRSYIDTKEGSVHFGDASYRLNTFALSYIGRDMKVHSRIDRIDANERLCAVVMKSYNMLLLMDRSYFDSTYIQLFVLGNYDKELFEPVIVTPMAMVYRLKR